MQRRDEVLATAEDMASEPAPELELAVHLEGLPAQRRLKAHTMLAQPHAGLETVADQHLGEFGITAIFGEPPHVIEILAIRVATEIDRCQIEIGNVGCQMQQVVD